MKNIIIIVFVGKNNVFHHTGHLEFSQYFSKITLGHNVILSRQLFDGLTDTSPPFPCRKVYIVCDETEKEPCVLDPTVTNTTIVRSLAEALPLLNEDKKTYVLADKKLLDEVTTLHRDLVDYALIITVHQEVEGSEQYDPLSPLGWQSILLEEIPADKHSSGLSIVKHQNEATGF